MRKRKQKRAQGLSRENHECFVVIYGGKRGWCFENYQVCALARYLSMEAAGCRIGNSGPLQTLVPCVVAAARLPRTGHSWLSKPFILVPYDGGSGARIVGRYSSTCLVKGYAHRGSYRGLPPTREKPTTLRGRGGDGDAPCKCAKRFHFFTTYDCAAMIIWCGLSFLS
jgi:hypothetical protein